MSTKSLYLQNKLILKYYTMINQLNIAGSTNCLERPKKHSKKVFQLFI